MIFDGEKLTDLIIKARKKYKDVADDVGVSREMLHKWRTGQHQPRRANIERLAELFNLEWKDLFKDE